MPSASISFASLSAPTAIAVPPVSQRRAVRFRSTRAPATNIKCGEHPSETPTLLHFIGIGGSGVSALAIVALSQGYRVSGSDLKKSAQFEHVQTEGATCFVGHFAGNVGSQSDTGDPPTVPGDIRLTETVPDALVVSSAVPEKNVEILFAKQAVYNRSQWLARITKKKVVAAVAGTHGKTTTSAMLSVIMRENEFDISSLVGGRVRQFPGEANAVGGSGDLFVIEADEYDGAFLGLKPTLAIVTNIDFEHPDMFEDIEDVRSSFTRFLRRVHPGGCIIACGDDVNIRNTQVDLNKDFVTYGFGAQNCWRAVDVTTNLSGGSDFSVFHSGEKVCEVSLPLPGHHNVLNALAALVAALMLAKTRDPSWVLASESSPASESLSSFTGDVRAVTKTVAALEGYRGIARRMQHIGTVGTCAVFDDYAHHPTAIRAVIGAMRQRFVGARLVVFFQPHTFSRTAVLLHEFADALSLADRVLVTAVYDARTEVNEEFSHQVSGQDLARVIGTKGLYFESLWDATRQLVIEAHLVPGRRGLNEVNQETVTTLTGKENITTVFLCLGAGSSNQLSTVVHTCLLAVK